MRRTWVRVTVLAAAALLSTSGAPLTGLDPIQAKRSFPPVSTWKLDLNRLILAGDLIPPFKKAAQTRLEYAQMCAAEMGDIPEFNCFDGEVIPVKVSGEPVMTVIPGKACDAPAKLEMGKSNCVPGSRLRDLSPPGKPAVTIIGICRKYDKPMAADNFADIAIIAHNRDTGTTCYFQSPVAAAPDGYDGHQIPSPMSNGAAADKQWLGPKKGADGITYTTPGLSCTNCHDADPFILSPYVQQVVTPEMLDRWNAGAGHIVDKFGWFSPLAGRPWVVRPGKTEQATDKCTKCHSVGGGSLSAISSGEKFEEQTNFHGYMPTDDVELKAKPWQEKYGTTITALEQCLYPPGGAAPNKSCNVVRAGQVK